MKTDWNSDGKHDWQDDYVDYKISSSSEPSSQHNSHGKGSFRIPTWLLVALGLGIVSGELPINGFTILLAVIMAVVIWIRVIS